MRSGTKTSRYSLNILFAGLAVVLVVPSAARGMFFREDFLRYFSGVAVLGMFFALLAFMQDKAIWRRDTSLALVAVAGLYVLTMFWAKSRMAAADGALKYGVYVLVFIMSRYASREEGGSSWIRLALIVSGLTVSMIGFLSAAGTVSYRDAVAGGRLAGSFQYPNSLAAFAMFVSFLTLFSWYRAEGRILRVAYALGEYVLIAVVVLSYSRATWMVYAGFLALYVVVLPQWSRFEIASRWSLATLAVVAVNVPLAAAISKSNPPAVRRYFLTGAAICAVFELVRPYALRTLTGLVPRTRSAAEKKTAATVSPRKAPARLVIPLAVAACLVLLIAAVPGAGSALSKLVPPGVAARFRSISLKDPSLLGRLYASRDAWLIALDNPFGTGSGGWNSLYHMYQRSLYFFTETHNHFAQVLVETGFPGLLAYCVFWAGVAYAAVRTIFRGRAAALPLSVNRWHLCEVISLAAGVASLAVHSMADFDLSIPAISVSLFSAAGSLMSLSQTETESGGKAKGKTRKAGTGRNLAFRTPSVAHSASVLCICALILLPAQRYHNGMMLGSSGISSVLQEEVERGRGLLVSAMKYDPLNASYPLDLAQTYAEEYVNTSANIPREAALRYLEVADKADPLNLQYLLKQSALLLMVGSHDKAVDVAARAVGLMPLDGGMYRYFADSARVALLYHVNTAVRNRALGPDDPDIVAGKKDIALIESLPGTIAQRKASVRGAEYRSPEQVLDVSPAINLALGQAAFLRGDSAAALSNLTAASKNPALAREANTWLDALSQAASVKVVLPPGYPHSDDEVKAVAAFFGLLR